MRVHWKFEAYEKESEYGSHWVIIERYRDGTCSSPLFPLAPQGDTREELIKSLQMMLKDIMAETEKAG
jgi:hypothetical protein